MKHRYPAAVLSALLLGGAAVALPQTPAAPAAPPPAVSPGDIVAAAPADAWIPIAARDMLVMTLPPTSAPGARGTPGKPRRIVIQLMPAPISDGWVANIRRLAAAHWWDGTSVNRVQDNYVVQWGDASEKKPLPDGMKTVPESDYVAVPTDTIVQSWWSGGRRYPFTVITGDHLPRPYPPAPTVADPYADAYSFVAGMPFALEAENRAVGGHFETTPQRLWPVHCYGMVGVARNLSPDAGSGAELYTVIGQAPRHLDRNIALVGRVIEGMALLSSLPRGTGALGFYETAGERVQIVSVRLASDLPAAERPRYDYLSTESASFARYAEARANRRDAFFIRPAGAADICNVPVPVRPGAKPE